MAQLLVAKARLRPRFSIIAVGLDCLFKVGQGLLAVVFGKKAKSVAKKLNRLRALIAPGCGHQIGEGNQSASLQLRDPFRRNCKIDALSSGDLQSGNADNLSLHIDHRAAAGTRRNRGSDLNYSSKGRYVPHRGNNSVGATPSKTKGIPYPDAAPPSLWRLSSKQKRTSHTRGRIYLEQCQVAFSINSQHAFHLIDFSR